MAVDNSIKENLNRVIDHPVPRRGLPPRPLNRSIGASRGAGIPTENTGPATAPATVRVRKAVLTIYSSILVTEDDGNGGAWERPPNFPTSGAYPHTSEVFDVAAQYYEQRRVHLTVYEEYTRAVDGNGNEVIVGQPVLVEQHEEFPLERPFVGAEEYCQGITVWGSFDPDFKMRSSVAVNFDAVSALMEYYNGLGVAYE